VRLEFRDEISRFLTGRARHGALAVWAGGSGYWNATTWTVAQMSTWNDFRQLGLEPNYQGVIIPAIAFSHTQYASCGVTITQTVTEAVGAYLAGSGYTDTATWTRGLSAKPVTDSNSEVDLHQYSSGAMNETNPVVVQAGYGVGGLFDPSENAIPEADWLTSPPSGQTYPIPGYPGYMIDTVGQTGGGINYSYGGSFEVSTGIDIALDIGLSGGWQGVPVEAGGGATIPLSYEISASTSSTSGVDCSLTDSQASNGLNAQFYYYVDGTESSNQAAINMHIWFDDYCSPNPTTCS
jgi:hypothetical protein